MTFDISLPTLIACITFAIGTIIAGIIGVKRKDIVPTLLIVVLSLFVALMTGAATDAIITDVQRSQQKTKLPEPWKKLYHLLKTEPHSVHQIVIRKFLKQNKTKISLEQYKLFNDPCLFDAECRVGWFSYIHIDEFVHIDFPTTEPTQ